MFPIRDIGGLAFCGVSSTPEIFISIAFLGHFFGLWGFIKAKIFRKFSNKVRKFSKNRQFFEKRPIFALFCPKMPFLGPKTLFFSKFRRLRRRNVGFHRPPSAAEVWNLGPPWAEAPPKISLILINSNEVQISAN